MKHLPIIIASLFLAFTLIPPQPRATGPVAVALSSASPSDRATLSATFRALADVMRRDAGRRITTTGVWRAVYKDALALAVGGTDVVGKYPDLDKAVEEVLANYYSLDDVAIDQDIAQKITTACTEVARQSGG
jgi:hypothetical protein